MGEIKRVGDLEVSEDPAYERRASKVRRVSNIVWALLILAAVLGLFGTGPPPRARRISRTIGRILNREVDRHKDQRCGQEGRRRALMLIEPVDG